MSFPIHSNNTKIFNGLAADANQTSGQIDIRESLSFSVQVDWSGGAGTTATISVEGTNYNASDATVSVIWSPVTPDSGSGVVASNSGSTMLNFKYPGYDFFRVKWVQSAGAGGTINSFVSVKSAN